MNRSKAKGTRAETRVARYLTIHGLVTKRKALAGSSDNGDLCMRMLDGTEVTIEVKAGEQTANYNRSKLNGWKSQTLVEGKNSGCPAVLVIVRHRRAIKDAEVWIPNIAWDHAGWTMMFLDEFIEWIHSEEEV